MNEKKGAGFIGFSVVTLSSVLHVVVRQKHSTGRYPGTPTLNPKL